MKKLNYYLEKIQMPGRRLFDKKLNAPCAAYETVYGKKCPNRPGRYMKPHETKMWKGIDVDGHLEEKWLEDLSNIKGIEIRSSCEGHEKDWVAFVIFRFLNKNKDRDNILIKSKLEASDKITKVGADIGNGGFMRYVVAAPTWYGQPDWEKWWSTLAKRIKGSIK